jgi:uncharacterized protein YdiU (UPF0061 family)
LNSLQNLNLNNTFVELGEEFYQVKQPDPVTEPYLVDFNPDAAELIGLNPEEHKKPGFVAIFSGNQPLAGGSPLAMDYSGHQFGSYNPRIGDGRGLLLGQAVNSKNESWDIHLKGAGPTRFARGFDGRATLRASIREHLAGEALHGLGIPTTRSLAIIGIRDLIYRETPDLAAILVRISDSHIRFGSFENFYYLNRPDLVVKLADHVIEFHYPDLLNSSDKYRHLYRRVIQLTASMIAQWQAFGFVHGVMNTDNMSITGTTFDYGPFGFLDRFSPLFTANSSDTGGRYAFARQAEIGHWNLGKLGEALSPVLEPEEIHEELLNYQPAFNQQTRELMGQKLGLSILDQEFTELTGKMFQLLNNSQADYTVFFRHCSQFDSLAEFRGLFQDAAGFDNWLSLYKNLVAREDADQDERKIQMDQANPKFILRNYLLQAAIDKALKEADFSEIVKLKELLKNPFQDDPELFRQYDINPDLYSAPTPESLIGMKMSCSA